MAQRIAVCLFAERSSFKRVRLHAPVVVFTSSPATILGRRTYRSHTHTRIHNSTKRTVRTQWKQISPPLKSASLLRTKVSRTSELRKSIDSTPNGGLRTPRWWHCTARMSVSISSAHFAERGFVLGSGIMMIARRYRFAQPLGGSNDEFPRVSNYASILVA